MFVFDLLVIYRSPLEISLRNKLQKLQKDLSWLYEFSARRLSLLKYNLSCCSVIEVSEEVRQHIKAVEQRLAWYSHKKTVWLQNYLSSATLTNQLVSHGQTNLHISHLLLIIVTLIGGWCTNWSGHMRLSINISCISSWTIRLPVIHPLQRKKLWSFRGFMGLPKAF